LPAVKVYAAQFLVGVQESKAEGPSLEGRLLLNELSLQKAAGYHISSALLR
jgi:hypothetical protein